MPYISEAEESAIEQQRQDIVPRLKEIAPRKDTQIPYVKALIFYLEKDGYVYNSTNTASLAMNAGARAQLAIENDLGEYAEDVAVQSLSQQNATVSFDNYKGGGGIQLRTSNGWQFTTSEDSIRIINITNDAAVTNNIQVIVKGSKGKT